MLLTTHDSRLTTHDLLPTTYQVDGRQVVGELRLKLAARVLAASSVLAARLFASPLPAAGACLGLGLGLGCRLRPGVGLGLGAG